MIKPEFIEAPFTLRQVELLNKYQENSAFHPYTCGNDSNHILVADIDGWRCPECDYKQNWAHRASCEVANYDSKSSWDLIQFDRDEARKAGEDLEKRLSGKQSSKKD